MNEEQARQNADVLRLTRERDRLREALTWAVGFIQCNMPSAVSGYEDMRNAMALVDGENGLFNGEFHRLSCRATVAEYERDRLRAELARYTDSAGGCDQNRHMANAAVAALGFPNRDEVSPTDIRQAIEALKSESELYQRGYDMIGAMDISNYLARCADAGRILEG
jgi:hypothetical protein